MKKSKIFLHIGHGKTGTSAIQSSLAIASEKLATQGIHYPIGESLRDRASKFEVTSGNWKPKPETSLADELVQISKKSKKYTTIILSSESLFWTIPELLSCKKEWQDQIDLHIIMAVREVEEMLSSEYQQRVKRHGDSMPLWQFIRARNFVSSHHAKAAEIINLMSNHQIPNTVINYSKHKQDISRLVFQQIGAEDAYPADKMDGAIINRSLSRNELEILIMINKLYHQKLPSISTIISDSLIKNQPNLRAEQCKISDHQLEKIYNKNLADLQTINHSLSEGEQLSTQINQTKEVIPDVQNKKKQEEELLSIRLIGDTLAKALANEYKTKLANETVDAIIKLSQSENLSKTVEVQLLEIAKENRPQEQTLSKLLEKARTKPSDN